MRRASLSLLCQTGHDVGKQSCSQTHLTCEPGRKKATTERIGVFGYLGFGTCFELEEVFFF